MSSFVEAQQINPRVEFWSHPQSWPRDATGVVFLGRVVQHLGRIVHGQQWTGEEPHAVVVYAIHRQMSAETPQRDINYACRLLYDRHLGYQQRSDHALSANEPLPLPIQEEWAFAFALSTQIEDVTRSALNRYSTVVRLLVRVFELGSVRTALRGNKAGLLTQISNGDWFNECYFAWFATCQVHPEFPFSQTPIREGGRWIYIEEESYLSWLAIVFDTVGQPQPEQQQMAPPVVPAETTPKADPHRYSSADASQSEAADEPMSAETVAATLGSEALQGPTESGGPTPAKPQSREPAETTAKTNPDCNASGQTTQPVSADELVSADTVAPTSGRVAVQVSTEGKDPSTTKPHRKKGARPKYDWQVFGREVLQRVRGGKAPNSVHDFANQMAEWCVENWGREPSNSRLRHYIDKALAENGLSLYPHITSNG